MVTSFVGRREELHRIEVAVSASTRGPGEALVIRGDPGIGKSRLIEAAAAMAGRHGLRVAHGRAVDHGGQEPLKLVTSALEDAATEQAAALDRRSRQLLTAFFPMLGSAGKWARVARREPERVHDALRRLLVGGRERGVVLLLDDVHWADTQSQRFLEGLLCNRPPDRVLVVLAYRPRQVSPRLAAAVAQAVDGGWGTVVTPSGLTFGDMAELVGAEVGGLDLRAAVADGQGNPRYVTLLLRRYTGGDLADEHGLAAELDSLTASALLLLRGAAVVGDPFDARVAAAVGEVADADRWPALDVLTAGDLVREADPGGGYRFRHSLLRDAVYAGSGPGWRAGAHARALAQLRPWCTDPVRLAPHVVEVAEPGESDAVRLLAGAAAAVLDTAPAQARRWAAAALALLTDRQDTRAELAGTVGTALVRTGCLGEGVDRLREALRLLPVDAAVRGTVACRAAEAFLLTGEPVAARAMLRSEAGRASQACRAGPPGRRAQRLLHVELAALECGEGNLGAAEYHLRAIEAPDGPDRDEVAALAECAVRAWVRAVAGDLATAHPAATRYADTVDALSDTQTTRYLEHLGYAVEALRQVGLWERGRQLARRGVALAHRAGWRPAQAALSAEVAWSDRLAGRLSSAVAAAAECVDLAETLGNPVLRCRGLTAGALALLWRDRAPGAALRAAESAIADADHGGHARRAELALAEVTLALGRSSGLAERIVLAGGGPGLSHWAVPARAWVYETLVRLALADGDQTAARTWTVRAEDVTAAYRLPCAGPVGLARAAVLLAEGDPTGAARAAGEAAGAFDRAGFPLEQARGRLLVAAASDRPAAAAELRKVKEIAVRCGSGRLHRLAGAAQASAGARHRADQGNDPPDLTDPLAALSRREREVAEQLRAGLTNREIAERLYITERTVETHVKHILHKLDLPSRAAVAGLVRR